MLRAHIRRHGLTFEASGDGITYQGLRRDGVFDWASGQQYRKDWLEGKRSGMCAHHRLDADLYEGGCKDDTKHGMSVAVFAYGYTFRGQFVNDMRVRGVCTWADAGDALSRFGEDGAEILSARITGMHMWKRATNNSLAV